jgi:hypothetical protein
MAIVILEDGAEILEADIVACWEAVRTEINGMGAANLRRKCFGPQHLPTIIPPKTAGLANGYDYGTITSEVLVDMATYPFTSVTDPDISANWKQMILLDGVAAGGYQLPACKVLVWAYVFIGRFSFTSNDHRAHFAITSVIDGGAESTQNLSDTGFVIDDISAYGISDLFRHEYEYLPCAIWTVIDQTGGGPWTLDSLRLRASADGSDYYIYYANLGFVALYKDS